MGEDADRSRLATPDTAEHYRTFGRDLGVAFQIVDDLLSIWGDSKRTGKPYGNDLTARKKSPPVVAALASGTDAATRLAKLYGTGDALIGADAERAAALVTESGGRTWAVIEADRRAAAALDALSRTQPHSRAESDLRALTALITERDH